MNRLAGKIALITGAAQGLGEAMARRMVEEGARVMLTDINEAGVKAVAASIGEAAAACRHDVTSMDDWAAAIAFAGILVGLAVPLAVSLAVSTSVRASHSGLPVSRAIRSANCSARWRTTLAKRRIVSMRNDRDLAAHGTKPPRAASTSASTSLVAARHSSAPVAGS